MTYDPGADAAARYPDWVIRHRRLGWGIPEVMCSKSKVILLEAGHSWAEKRCSLAHAVAHLDLEHFAGVSGIFDKRQESQANQLAARRLITLEAMAAALSWTRAPAEIAAELIVDRATLLVRRKHMHPSELQYLDYRVRSLGETA